MCSSEKCCQVETGTLIWAIFSTVVSGLATMLFFFTYLEYVSYLPDIGDGNFTISVHFYVISVSLMALIATTFMFSIVLILGAVKRSAGFVKAYFIFGVLNCVVLSSIIIDITVRDMLATHTFYIKLPIFIFLLLGIGVYGLILYMVKLTYNKFRDEAITPPQTSQQTLL